MDDYEMKLLNMTLDEMLAIANGDDNDSEDITV